MVHAGKGGGSMFTRRHPLFLWLPPPVPSVGDSLWMNLNPKLLMGQTDFRDYYVLVLFSRDVKYIWIQNWLSLSLSVPLFCCINVEMKVHSRKYSFSLIEYICSEVRAGILPVPVWLPPALLRPPLTVPRVAHPGKLSFFSSLPPSRLYPFVFLVCGHTVEKRFLFCLFSFICRSVVVHNYFYCFFFVCLYVCMCFSSLTWLLCCCRSIALPWGPAA